MWRSKTHFAALVHGIIVLVLLFLPACGLVPMPQNPSLLEPTITPTPTRDPSGYQSIAAEACLIADWGTLQTERRQSGTFYWQQGNMLAWQPDSRSGGDPPALAYLAPNDRSSWFTGQLMLAQGSRLETKISLAPNVLATGDLTWSPDGAWLGFLAFRPNESLYTVMAVQPGSEPVDLFPIDLARTDTRTSQKAILGWRNDDTLQAIASCGEECRSAYDLRVPPAAEPALTPTTIQAYQELSQALKPEARVQTITPAAFPSGMRSTYWSPDETRLTYLDRRGLLWLLDPERKVHYILDIGLRDVYEQRWSPDGDYLAVRAEDRVFIFQIPCQSGA